MTTIIMHETEDEVLIAFDSRVSGSRVPPDTSYAQKVFINPAADIILGVAGYLRAAAGLMNTTGTWTATSLWNCFLQSTK